MWMVNNVLKTILLALCALFFVTSSAQTLTVDASVVVADISPLIYGTGMEDVNHEIYGGLYDQRIFGEGFEELATMDIHGFTAYDSPWGISDGRVQLGGQHGKLVANSISLRKGTVEVEMRLEGASSIGGLIVEVSRAGEGMDTFDGYEISLDAARGAFVFGKHKQNWQPIARMNAEAACRDVWNTLRVEVDGATFTVMVGGKHIYTYTDRDDPLGGTQVGLRSVNGSASFRHLKIDGREVPLRGEGAAELSAMWDVVAGATCHHDGDNPFTGRYAQRIDGRRGDGIANRGLNRWGIAVSQGVPMHSVLYLRGKAQRRGKQIKACVALQNADGTVEYARATLAGITDRWQRFEADLVPDASDPNARFVLSLADEGTLWADQVLLATDHYPYRHDLTEAFCAEGLTFLRYGGTMVNAPDYLTRNMTGSPLEREPYDGHWYLNATNGFAIPEFVRFARLIGAEPSFAINIEDNPADVLRLLDETASWHPRLLEIGNEECIGTRSRAAYEHYVERFLTLYDAIHPVYPDMAFIIAAWWRPDEPATMEYVFRALDGKADFWDYHPWTETPEQAQQAEAVIGQMRQLFTTWNPHTTMRCAILEENGNTHDMTRALAHAVMLGVVRRSAGFVPLDSPANALQPWKQNDNGWDQGQIFFDASRTWMQPPYYAQQMASAHHQPLLVKADITADSLDVTVTRSRRSSERRDVLAQSMPNRRTKQAQNRTCSSYALQPMEQREQKSLLILPSRDRGRPKVSREGGRAELNTTNDTLVIHVVNMASVPRRIPLSLSGFGRVTSMKAVTLSGEASGGTPKVNMPNDPLRYVPEEQIMMPTDVLTVRANSYTVFVLAASAP